MESSTTTTIIIITSWQQSIRLFVKTCTKVTAFLKFREPVCNMRQRRKGINHLLVVDRLPRTRYRPIVNTTT
jgi:hypothetical protein